MGKLIDESGNVYGYLKVLGRDFESKHIKPYWLCECQKCKQIVSVYGTSLRKGTTTQCQKCAAKEAAQKRNQKIYNTLIGQKFNNFIVIEENYDKGRGAGQARYWNCKCKCGKIIPLSTHQILSKSVLSCGCSKQSKGEAKISQLLSENGIPFEEQKMFEDCRFPYTERKARFDFFIDNKYIIEFDGKQHDMVTGGLFTQDVVNAIIERDAFKNEWCKKNNIPIIRIKQHQLNTLTIEDLLYKEEE